jgi:hypothetical protein
MIWINPVTGNHNTRRFFSTYCSARQNAPIPCHVNRNSLGSMTGPIGQSVAVLGKPGPACHMPMLRRKMRR